MARKEIVVHLRADNLIRLRMGHAAALHGRDLRRLSFAGAPHRLRALLPLLGQRPDRRTLRRLAAPEATGAPYALPGRRPDENARRLCGPRIGHAQRRGDRQRAAL